jgi:ribosomal protein L16 Arg81 hydroxylase
VSLSILHELLADFGMENFLSHHLFQFPFASPQTAHRFKDLICWELLEELFPEHNNCWLPRQGRLPAEAELCQGRLTNDVAKKEFEVGRTILIRHAEQKSAKLKEIADDFHQLFHRPVDIQLYATPAGEEGFDWHYDVEDVFVIQSRGEKEFRLLPNTVTPRPLPMMTRENYFPREKKTPEIRCWLKAGDWLYIPAGYWHKARALTESYHLSVGVLCQSGLAQAL